MLLPSMRLLLTFILVQASVVAAWMVPQQVNRRQLGQLHSSKGPGTGTFVEGDVFDNPIDEINAMGGDPFFLDEDEVQDASEGWDGEVDENAHIDIDFN
jgi:hypothetical protein